MVTENDKNRLPENRHRRRSSSQSAFSSPASRTNKRYVHTSSRERRNISPHRSQSNADILEQLLKNPSNINPGLAAQFLKKIVTQKDMCQLKPATSGSIETLVKKYQKTIQRHYVCAVAAEDVQNYCSAAPKSISGRSDEIRLETMEQLFKKCECGQISEEQLAEINQTYFPDIIAKDSLPDAPITKILRCMAAGKFYAPVDKNGNLNIKALSPAYCAFRKRKKSKQTFSVDDYDFFGTDDKGRPLSPVFNAVNHSHNFHKMSKSIAQRMAEMGISPKEAYQFNAADIAHIMQRPGELKDIPFTDIHYDITDSPYQEFAEKFGLFLHIGSTKNIDYRKTKKFFLNHFATDQEKADDDYFGCDAELNLFIYQAQNLYQKLQQDFAENDISPEFLPAWIDSLINNKSINPRLVSCQGKKPFKIDIHHWERLSAAANDAVAADKNNTDNFGIMMQYDAKDFDIHAEQHKGESSHYVTSSFNEKAQTNNRKYLICTSSCFCFSQDYFHGRVDKYAPIEKCSELRRKLEKDSNNTPPRHRNMQLSPTPKRQRTSELI